MSFSSPSGVSAPPLADHQPTIISPNKTVVMAHSLPTTFGSSLRLDVNVVELPPLVSSAPLPRLSQGLAFEKRRVVVSPRPETTSWGGSFFFAKNDPYSSAESDAIRISCSCAISVSNHLKPL